MPMAHALPMWRFLRTGRAYGAAACVNGQLLVFGGMNDKGHEMEPIVERCGRLLAAPPLASLSLAACQLLARTSCLAVIACFLWNRPPFS